MKHSLSWSKKAIILLFWLIVWQLAAGLIHNRILLVGPQDTLRAFVDQLRTLPFWKSVWFSVSRICLGLCLAFCAGLLTGILSVWKKWVGEFLELPVQIMKSVPIASFVILALIWTGSENLSVFISFLVAYPVIHVNTAAGLLAADGQLLEMAEVFEVPIWRRAGFIYRTALYPYLESALKTAVGMGFKSGIAAEVIGVPDGSIGAGLYLSKIYLDTAGLFSWTLVILAVSVLFENVILFVLKKAAGRGVVRYERENKPVYPKSK